MSKDKVNEESLERRLFEVLQTNDPDKNNKILDVCGIIAILTVNWTLDKILSTKIGNLVLIIYFAVTWSLFKLYSLGV